jgi:hypothetical protein
LGIVIKPFCRLHRIMTCPTDFLWLRDNDANIETT